MKIIKVRNFATLHNAQSASSYFIKSLNVKFQGMRFALAGIENTIQRQSQ
jgi:hypothetical protein